MTCDCFLWFSNFYILITTTTQTTTWEIKTDRLHKIQPFLDMSRERFRKVYELDKQLSVDKSLVLFKGRLHFKQYIKTKRSRFGTKLYKLRTSNGITLDLIVYPGKVDVLWWRLEQWHANNRVYS